MGSGYVVGEPNMSEPMPSRLHPGWEVALHRYPATGNVWLWLRQEGAELWRPERAATEPDVEVFRRAGKLRGA